jgi:hypothetical protein
MADPGLSQANWNLRWERAGIIVALWKSARELRKRVSEEVCRSYNDNDFEANFASDVTLVGADVGVNTSAEGYLYVRLVANGGDWDVEFYKAAGGGGSDLMAKATAVADGAVATLAEQNSSGLTGSVTLDASVVAEADDVHKLKVFNDFKLQVDNHFDKDIERDGEMEQVMLRTLDRVESLARSAEGAAVDAFSEMLRLQLGPACKSGSTSDLTKSPTTDDGAVSVAFSGLLEDLRLGMKNNTSGGAVPQEVVKAVLSVGTTTYESGNIGTGTTTPPATVYEHQEGGTWSFTCSSATIGAQEFTAKFAPSDASRAHLVYESPIKLRVKKEWRDAGISAGGDAPRIGIKSLTVDYVRTITNTTGTPFSVTATDWSETGESADNTDSGVLYLEVEANGANWDISFYSDSNKPSSALVAKATGIASSASFTAAERNRSGLTVTGKMASSPAAGNDATVDLNVFDTDGRTDGDPDRFEIAITETSIGKGQIFFAEAYQYYANSDTSGGETVDEDYWQRGGSLLLP